MSRQGEIELTWSDEDGEEVTHSFPSKNEVCPTCEGFGTHLNPSIGNHAYSMEEFYEEFDEEGREEYFKRGGIYDVQCEECKGNKVIEVVDESRLSDEQKPLYAAYEKHAEEVAIEEAADRRTRWFEDGCPMD